MATGSEAYVDTSALIAFADCSDTHHDLTVADAVGLHVMGVHGVRTCWSTDFHPGITGVPLVIDSR